MEIDVTKNKKKNKATRDIIILLLILAALSSGIVIFMTIGKNNAKKDEEQTNINETTTTNKAINEVTKEELELRKKCEQVTECDGSRNDNGDTKCQYCESDGKCTYIFCPL